MTEGQWQHFFKDNLIQMTLERHMSQMELSALSGISQGTISKYMNGSQIPTAPSIVNLSYALGCSIEELIDFGEKVDA